MALGLQEVLSRRKFQEWYAFLHRTSRDAEEVAAVGLGEAPVAFRGVGGDGESGTIQLIGEEEVAAWQVAGERADYVRERDRLLVESFSKAKGIAGASGRESRE
jgi:hypothetical protein